MKKFTLIIALLLCLSVALCACNEETPAQTDPQTQTQPVETTLSTEPQETEAQVDSSLLTYTVKLVDEAGNPIVSGGVVQLCLDSCIPNATNDNGCFTWQAEQADYKVSFIKLPDGYTYSSDATDFYFDAGSTEMTIVLKAA